DSQARSHRLGIILALMTVFIFAAQDGITKVLVQNYAPPQIIMVRFWAFALFAVIFAAMRGGLGAAARSKAPGLQIFRSVLLIVQMMIFAFGLRFMGLADAHALFATYPLIATALAAPILGEHVGWRRLMAVGIGFAGALVIIRPGLTVFDPAGFIQLTAALGFAFYSLLTRKASFHDNFATSILYLGIFGAIAATAIGLPLWKTPDGEAMILMAILSVTGIIGHLFLIKALEHAPATLLQPFNYTSLVWASLIGFAIFGEIPDSWTVAGAAIIVGAGGYVVWRERMIGNTKAR
ncbi:MAG: DMT family transporter, partial [Alphaproteobacteria bacterium]|nr:DMT family transporter [Alphaproteobacteria bacterium]